MQVSVEKVSNVERRLTIVIPADQVENAYEEQLKEIAKKANLRGFRPGKAPMSFVRERFGVEARRDAVNELMKNAFYKAIVDEKLQPISAPRLEPKVTSPDKPLEFVVSFEVIPDIDQVKFTAPEIEKLKVDVKEEDLDRVINQLQKQYSEWNVVDRPAQLHDRVVIDYHLLIDGEPDLKNKIESYPLELGSKQMLAGFEEGLIGLKANEEKTLNLTFPADFPIAERAGKSADFVIKVKQVLEAKRPDVSEDFIKKLGVSSGAINELRKQIRQTLEQERDRLVREKLKEQVFGKLIEQNPIDVPTSLVASEAKAIHDEIYPQHRHQNEEDHHHEPQEISRFNDVAKKRVMLGLLIAEYAKKTGLKADAERVNARIREIATAYESPQEVINWLSSKEKRGEIEAQVLEDQVMEKLMEASTINEKEQSYSELKGVNE